MADLIEGVKLVGGLAGLTALGFKVYEELVGYLKVRVQVDSKDNIYSVQTEIENTSKWSRKKIENAFLIISPENSDLIETGVKIAKQLKLDYNIKSTNDFKKLTSEHPLYFDCQIGFIPLDFYYSENIAIGNEKLTYRCLVDKT
ncbi:hypothetical protein QM480_00120 [Flectobacillus sp. DC10W]|uniref:Uncharacterized protein n=1 Tax=Flectobacillus longus TaxID=2984207 RepID=A0ABT6YGZ8_9BACT|nr:hypothetical protein [Flectobacillus longus]MDI9862707.1 hypothetical protein [Flectobacillus longus]